MQVNWTEQWAVCVCVRACVCARARVRACVCAARVCVRACMCARVCVCLGCVFGVGSFRDNYQKPLSFACFYPILMPWEIQSYVIADTCIIDVGVVIVVAQK